MQQSQHKTNQIDYNHVLDNLQDYMLTSKLITMATKNTTNNNPQERSKLLEKNNNTVVVEPILIPKSREIPIPEPNSEKPPSPKQDNKTLDLYYPKQKDSLFWCYFIIKNGFSKYEYPGTTTFVFEKEEKFKSVELLRQYKQDLKTHKIKNIKEHVEDELINKERIGMKTFIALCVASKLNVLFIHKRKCFDLVSNLDLHAKTHIVVCEDNLKCAHKYGVEIEIDEKKAAYYRDNYFNWESVDKPLKAMGSYKSEELSNLCGKIGIDITKSQRTKKEMYELLIINM
uniref:Uncharacterized protein n=1 Tax=viral metagenome TaxID=1070528 RepID=A0A6C0KW71_9ZZZZ